MSKLYEFEIWMKGYCVQGNSAPESLVGIQVAHSFEEACDLLCSGRGDYDSVRGTIWGCKLYLVNALPAIKDEAQQKIRLGIVNNASDLLDMLTIIVEEAEIYTERSGNQVTWLGRARNLINKANGK